MPLFIYVILDISICGMHEFIIVMQHIFLLMDLFSYLCLYEGKALCTFWWALKCNHCLCLFCFCMYLFLDCILTLLLLLIWYYENWKLLIIMHQTLVLITLCLCCLGTFLELACIFCHPLVPACSGFCIPTQTFLSSLHCEQLLP